MQERGLWPFFCFWLVRTVAYLAYLVSKVCIQSKGCIGCGIDKHGTLGGLTLDCLWIVSLQVVKQMG